MLNKLVCLSTTVSLRDQHVIFPERRLCSVAELFQQLSVMVIWMVTGFQGSHEVVRIADFCVEIQT